ncbi:MAG: dephospho-CoA kinase [Alphaproteobacteria bacterium]
MLLVGLTGSIAMGKSVASRILRRARIPVHDADAAVHALMARGGGAVEALEQAFPGCVREGAVDRAILRQRISGDAAAKRRLEAIVHPLVRAATRRFVARHARARRAVVVLDIPLLYETRAEDGLDAVLVVSAPAWLQRARALRRPGMTPELLAAFLAWQVADAQKRRRADAVATSALGQARTRRDLLAALRAISTRAGRAWKPGWK